MAKAVVLYDSKYGSTERYARWIADALSADIFHVKTFLPQNFAGYDTIIYGGGLYAAKIKGGSMIARNFSMLHDKEIIVFSCGLADPLDDENLCQIHRGIDKIFSEDMKKRMRFFHFRGAINYGKLTFCDRCLMALLKLFITRKKTAALRAEDREFLATYGKIVDFVDKKAISPLVLAAQNAR